MTDNTDFDQLTTVELRDMASRAVAAMARSGLPGAGDALAQLAAEVGQSMGQAWSTHARSEAWHPPGGHARAAADPNGAGTELTLYGINEPQPGSRWQSLFDSTWPQYRLWYLSEGEQTRPDVDTCESMLARYMPELVPTWRRMVALTGGDELAARMLTLWDPPAFLPGCSQAALARPPMLVRNYDYSPDLFERVVYSSRFTGRRVLGTGDCLWGLLDGMNDSGLAVSLAFGGEKGTGHGFAIPLVVRYLLEVAATLGDVRQVLHQLPVMMTYNLTVVDGSGHTLTAHVGPGRVPEFSDAPVATNHRGATPRDPLHAARLRSVERQHALLQLLRSQPDPDKLAAAFLRPPLYNTAYSRGFGTLYTAAYRPADGTVDYLWPGEAWRRSFDSPEDTITVRLYEPRPGGLSNYWMTGSAPWEDDAGGLEHRRTG